jgi:hypothetical protein
MACEDADRHPQWPQVADVVIEAFLSLSLSRLNHWLPRAQAHQEVMQGTADFHHQIADARLPQADPVFDDATALDAPVDRLDPQPTVMQGLVGPLLFPGEFLAAGFLGRHEDLDVGQRERQEAQVPSQPTPGGQGRGRRVGNGFVMDATAANPATTSLLPVGT